MADIPTCRGIEKTYISVRFGVTDKPLTETENYDTIPALERERRIRYILYGGYVPNGFKKLSSNLREDELSSVSDESAELWKDLLSKTITVSGTGDNVWAIGYFDYDSKTILALMAKYAVLPPNPSEDDIGRFVSERAAMAHWIGFDYLADVNSVPPAAHIWWGKYIAHPTKGDSNSTKEFNVINECGLLITAGLLPKFFTEKDLLLLSIERAHISSSLDIALTNGMGDSRYWELTQEGITAAATMGLLDSTGNLIENESTDITPGTSETKAPSSKRKMKVDTSGFFNIRALAERNNIPGYNFQRFEKAVRRWHRDNPESNAVQETTYRNRNQAKWIFKEDEVMHIIKKYQQKD